MKSQGLKRQESIWGLALLGIAVAAFVGPRLWPQTTTQACAQYPGSFTENFATVGFKDAGWSSVARWPAGPITLPPLGSNFIVGAAGALTREFLSFASADFTGDGRPDLIGLDLTGQAVGDPVNPKAELRLVRNTGPVPPFAVDMSSSYEKFHTDTGACALTAGDYNGDGLADFFLMRNSVSEFGYTNFLAAMYINMGTAAAPDFQPSGVAPTLDFTAAVQAARIYCYGTAGHLASVDIDRDGDIDMLAISQDKIFLLRNPGSAAFTVDDWSVSELTAGQPTGFPSPPGGSAVAAADFDGDGDQDIVAGTIGSASFLAYYENDGHGQFVRTEIAIPDPSCVGPLALMADDFTGDGRPDIFVVTDQDYRGASDSTAQSRIWFLRNRGLVDGEISWLFRCLNGCSAPSAAGDIDMAAALDYDNDGDVDIVLADANNPTDYAVIVNERSAVFELYGRAQSTNVAAGLLDPRLHAITRVKLSAIRQGVLGASSAGLSVTVSFSNNGGRSWELYRTYAGAAIVNDTTSPWYDFKNFGADLRWRIDLNAAEDTVVDQAAASTDTPAIGGLTVEFVYVDRREYSRASAAATIVTESGINKKLIIGASFIFPGWEGQLRAYDVSGIALGSGTTSTLRTITTSDLDSATGRTMTEGASIYWDAGQLLNDRSPDTRTIYTAVRAGAVLTNPLVRQDFSRANAATLAPFLNDVQNNNAGLIDFVRGVNRTWKLGDINHSTPVVVGPPAESSDVMGTGYAEFKAAQAARRKVIYVGANDGMLHCFDAATGEELWGFIPYNLLPKLTSMYAVDPASATRYFSHGIYCDGTPAVADVEIGGSWRTVLVTGQGPGAGSTIGGGLNYYWALDITDPADPRPLWELSHTYTSGGRTTRTMGETWSTPAIGRVNVSGTPRWVAFMGSGYDNDATYDVGRRFYAVGVGTGAVINYTALITQVNTASLSGQKSAYSYPNIVATIPGSPTAVDRDRNGFLDAVYVGDLDGRLYRVNVTGTNPTGWTLSAIYTDYLYYPIITKPAVWFDPFEGDTSEVRVYFGTGGDDAAPADREYSFVALIDGGGNTVTVEWYLGVPALLNLDAANQRGTLGVGSKVWADPVVADQIVYFSTLRGSIEAVNPCLNLGEAGRLYARYVRYSSTIPVGGTAFKATSGTPPEYLDLISKARRAVTVGEAERVEGRINKREIYVQEYDSTMEKLEQPIGSLLRIRSWREIYRIIR